MEFSLEYKGGKPTFRADGRLYHLIYPHIFPEEEEDNISMFMVKLNERLSFLFKDIMDEYDKVNEARYGTGIGFSCEVDGVGEYDLGCHLQAVANLRLIRSLVGLTKSIQICFRLN